MDFNTLDPIDFILFAGLFITGFFLLLAFTIRKTKGLFFSRSPQRFLKDQDDPRYKTERQVGLAFSTFVLHYFPPLFLAFLILSLLWFL